MSNIDEHSSRIEGKFGAMVVCWMLGLGSLVSWNSMLTIGDYYYHLFPDYHPARVFVLVYQSFSLGTMALLAAYSKINSTTKRSLPGYILFFISTLGFLMLDVITSGRGGIEIYIGVCVFVACFGVADAHVQAGMLGDLASINPDFIQSFLAGVAASGALTSALRLTTKAAFDKSNNGLRKGALLFLAISTFCEVLCIFLYAFVFSKLSIVKYYRTRAAQEGLKAVAAADMIQTNPSEIVDTDIKFPEGLKYKALLIENYDYALGIYLLYLLTLSIYPGFLFENTGNHQLGSWYPLVLIAIYNVCDLLARHIPLLRCLKLESRKGLMIAVLSRFLFIPAFLFTAKYGDQAWMIMLITLLGLTNGYLMVCLMTLAPKGYKGRDANALGNLLVLCLLCGIFSGIALGWLWMIGNGSF